MAKHLQFDKIGVWSEIKLEILKKYAAAYSIILSSQTKAALSHVYIDAFAGAGKHLSRASQELVPGSPLNALAVRPEFREFHLIDIAPEKIEACKSLSACARMFSFIKATAMKYYCRMFSPESDMTSIVEDFACLIHMDSI